MFKNLRTRFPESFKKTKKLELNGLVSGILITKGSNNIFLIDSDRYEIITGDASFVIHSSDIIIQIHPSQQNLFLRYGTHNKEAEITRIEKSEDNKFIIEIKHLSPMELQHRSKRLPS